VVKESGEATGKALSCVKKKKKKITGRQKWVWGERAKKGRPEKKKKKESEMPEKRRT